MRKFFGFIVTAVCCVALCISCGNKQQNESVEQPTETVAVEKVEPVANGVFVCNGKFAKRYHRTPHCSGLGNCQGEIVEMTVEQAEAQGKTPCKKCY